MKHLYRMRHEFCPALEKYLSLKNPLTVMNANGGMCVDSASTILRTFFGWTDFDQVTDVSPR